MSDCSPAQCVAFADVGFFNAHYCILIVVLVICRFGLRPSDGLHVCGFCVVFVCVWFVVCGGCILLPRGLFVSVAFCVVFALFVDVHMHVVWRWSGGAHYVTAACVVGCVRCDFLFADRDVCSRFTSSLYGSSVVGFFVVVIIRNLGPRCAYVHGSGITYDRCVPRFRATRRVKEIR